MVSFLRHSALQVAVLITFALAMAGCSSPPASVAPPNLELVCSGEGSPTVILSPGVATPAEAFESLQAQIETDTRVCSYSRAGIGKSPRWPENEADPSAGMAADQLRATLETIATCKAHSSCWAGRTAGYGRPGIRAASPRRDGWTRLSGFVGENHLHPGGLRLRQARGGAVRPIDMGRTREDLSRAGLRRSPDHRADARRARRVRRRDDETVDPGSRGVARRCRRTPCI